MIDMSGLTAFSVALSILPAVIAWSRGHLQAQGITIVNIVAVAIVCGTLLAVAQARTGPPPLPIETISGIAYGLGAVAWITAFVWGCEPRNDGGL